MKDTVTLDTPALNTPALNTPDPDSPDPGARADDDAGATTRRIPDPENLDSLAEVDDDTTISDLSAATTGHLRQLWMAGARDITVTYDADVVRHRAYLSHPRTPSHQSRKQP